jgi:hypothetical protein
MDRCSEWRGIMREDMAQVIIERPRLGSRLPTKGKGYDRRNARLGWDDAVKAEGMGLRGGATKHLNENLAPLRRYLAGQVGQPWAAVHADICRHLDRNSAVQDHVRDHVADFVAVNVTIIGGELCHGDRYGVGRPLYTPFYVCPRTGILKKNKRQLPRRLLCDGRRIALRPLGGNSALVRRNGVWLVGAWRALPTTELPYQLWPWDALCERQLSRRDAEQLYGRAIHVTDVRQASKREIRPVVSSYPNTNRLH